MASEFVATSLFPSSWSWEPPNTYTKITTIDTHTGGEPLRIPISGLPPIHGSTSLAKRRYFMTHYDKIRTALLLEPRGHKDMYGAILTTPSVPEADLDVFFINTEGYSTMCGHGVLAITKVVLETGVVVKEGSEKRVVMNTPAGLCYASASTFGIGSEVRDISFRNVASFVYLKDQKAEVDGIGTIAFDIAFGGLFYAFIDAETVGCSLQKEDLGTMIERGRKIKNTIMRRIKVEHPFEPDLSSLFGVIFTGKPQDSGNHSRHVTVFEDGEVDRSSTGTGVSARAALLIARGELRLNETIKIESVIGSTLNVRVVETNRFGGYEAIVPEVGGDVSITGKHELYFHGEDPYAAGFMLRS